MYMVCRENACLGKNLRGDFLFLISENFLCFFYCFALFLFRCYNPYGFLRCGGRDGPVFPLGRMPV
jgi:hypothetical protein